MRSEFKKLEEEILSGAPVKVPGFLKEWLSKPKLLRLGGREVASKETFETLNPATEEVLARVAMAGRDEVESAIRLARRAFDEGAWRKMPAAERARYLRELGDRVLEHRAPLALIESLDTGKPIRESFEGDIPRAAQNFHFFADFALHEESPHFPGTADLHSAYREPLGVVALITPWNLPLYLETWKLAPALMMGNSVILKPSELTPLSAAYLAELMEQLGFPEGIFHLLQGFGENSTGEFLTSSPGIDAISFTGETGTGRAIMRSAACGPTRISFEMGGKGASVVFADADLDCAVAETAGASFRNQGEICLCCPRIFVEKAKFDVFVERFIERARAIKPGDPLSYGTGMGALISQEHWNKVMGYVRSVERPGEIRTGGKRPESLRRGYYLEPTVITHLGLDHPVSREEVFGPVVSIYPFSTEEEAIRAANDTPYGLSATIWTADLERADRVARGLRSGLVWINCWFVRDLRVPFGGQKRSGVGREGGRHSLDFFSEWKSVCVRTGGVL